MTPEYVKMVMFAPFGRDAYYECYIQINGNEKNIEFMYKMFKKNKHSGVTFKEIYHEAEVDTILLVKGNNSSGSFDAEHYVKLKGKLNIDIKTKVTNVEQWWEGLIEDSKWPNFKNIAEEVIYSENYKETDRRLYKPKDYRILKPKTLVKKID